MKKILLIIFLVWLALFCLSFSRQETANEILPGAMEPAHPNKFFLAECFNPDVANKFEILQAKIQGAVVPHHLLAHQLISEVFVQLQRQQPSLIILVGPNHYNRGERILTGTWSWQTPFGTVETEGEVIEELLKSSPVQKNDRVLGMEHSLGNLMPFIKFYLPETKVVPLIFHRNVTNKEAKLLAAQLNNVLKNDTVIIASVDFSHYLTREEAEEKDLETLAALKDKNMGRIFTMGNDYLDSPASLGLLFAAMENQGLQDFTVLTNTNSGIILGNDLIETTSYITLVFSQL